MSKTRKIEFLVVHCSDSPLKNHDNVETLRRWHIERGFSDIGYHYVITMDGKVHEGRPEQKVGAHAINFNSGSIGICLTGRNQFTEAQLSSLESLCKKLCEKYNLNKLDILGHSDLTKSKTCPNFNVQQLVAKWGWH